MKKSDSSGIIKFTKINYTEGLESLLNNIITQKIENTIYQEYHTSKKEQS